MAFNSLTFIIFFIIVVLLHHLPISWRAKKFNLLVASYLFYMAWDPGLVILIWVSTAVDWTVVKRMARTESRRVRLALLITSVAVNLGILGYFKYGVFVLDNLVLFAAQLGLDFQPAQPNIILPLGISFYTFQTMSYTIDAYRRQARPAGSMLDFALYVTFFPQLVAGPIVRSGHFLPQCGEARRFDASRLGWGVCLMLIGLFEKVALADNWLAPVADQVYTDISSAGRADAWLGAMAFTGQIFFDFSGYSTCAIGAALCLGFSLPDNFRFPYGAIGFRDFWRRWHISLSTWLRDYLYVSLGGNRKGAARTYVNVMLTMLIGGLWHGASWRFVAWGGMHGLLLVAERALERRLQGSRLLESRAARFFYGAFTFLTVCLVWTFFRAQTFSDAIDLIAAMFIGGPGELAIGVVGTAGVIAIVSALVAGHCLMRGATLEQVAKRTPWWLAAPIAGFMLFMVIASMGEERGFIYFQF